ncbi:hypothetical protein K501DRAFT_233671 [Backusella circina FSU 941]|nr:hypothetical protein K501DRAFT_233671 [Backusella circina FSU 941]
MLMNAQKQNKNTNNHHVMDELACEWCQKETKANRCHFCEKGMCVNCLQECIACLESYCSACYTIDYSHAYERVLCLSCKNG